MAEKPTSKKGGFHIGNVGRGVNLQAGVDIVGGDKTTTTTITKTIQAGFSDESKKQQFLAQIEQLIGALREVKAAIEAHSLLHQDHKEEAAGEIIQHLKVLKEIKEKAADVSTGKQATPEVAAAVEKALDRTGDGLKKLLQLANKAGGIGKTVAELAAKCAPIIVSARHLFGLP